MRSADFVTTLFHGEKDPNKVTVAFTMALNAAMKGHDAVLILMVEAVTLGRPGAVEGMAIGAPFAPVAELLAKFRALGGRVAICGSCMIHNGMSAAEMDPGYEIIGAPEVVYLLMNAKGSLQIA